MAQRQGQRKNQGRTGPSTASPPRAANGNGAKAKGANRASAASTFTAETAREERNRATGRRARARIAQEQAARRRRLSLIGGAITAVVIVAIIVVAVLLNSGTKTAAAITADDTKLNPGAPLKVGMTAPNFNLATIDGKNYQLSALRGHPVLLEFFAVWCPHCQAEAPILNNLDKAYASKGLQTLSILASPYDRTHDATGSTNPVTKDDITWFKNTYNVAHPMLIDPNFSTVNKYGANSYPTIYILDKNGVIRYTNGGLGDRPYQTLAHGVDAAIKGQSVKQP
jgi:thiol-disulfide isomerase/thioredoxin